MWTKNVQIDVQDGFQRDRRTRDQIANICGIIEKAKEINNNIYFCFIDYSKAFDYVDHNKLRKFLKRCSSSIRVATNGMISLFLMAE